MPGPDAHRIGKQFTGKFNKPRPTEILFDRICRKNGIEHLLTKIRSPTTTGKVERWHQTLQRECLGPAVADDLGRRVRARHRTHRPLPDPSTAEQARPGNPSWKSWTDQPLSHACGQAEAHAPQFSSPDRAGPRIEAKAPPIRAR